MPEQKALAILDSPRGWLVVAGTFIAAFVSFGVTYTFGVFLKPMSLEFHVSHAAMSVLFSVIAALTFFLAPFTGDLADHFGPRPVVAAGAALMGAALLVTARLHSFPLVMLTYGGGLGAAAACTYIPSVAAVGEWFKVHRDIALGTAISGIGCGTLVAAPLSALLIERYGWRTSFEIFGWSSFGLLLIAAALLAPPPCGKEKQKVSVVREVRTPAFFFLYASLMLSGIAIYVTFVFLPAYAAHMNISRVAGAALLGYVGAASVVGRLGLNALAPRFGLMTMYETAFALLLLSVPLWFVAHAYTPLVLFAIVMGVGYGGIAAMAPAVAASLFGVEALGELLGILFTGFGVACLIGPPLAGMLVDYTLDFKWPIFVAAGAAILAMIFVIPLRRYRAQSETELAAAA